MSHGFLGQQPVRELNSCDWLERQSATAALDLLLLLLRLTLLCSDQNKYNLQLPHTAVGFKPAHTGSVGRSARQEALTDTGSSSLFTLLHIFYVDQS